MSHHKEEHKTFQGLGISKALLQRIQNLGFSKPTPIQQKAIPIATQGEDVVGVAQTGSGKTLAFAIPMLEHVLTNKTIGLVLLPTRELAVQVEEEIRKVAGTTNVRTALLIGGTNPRPQIKKLRANPQIIIATPGRLVDHLQQKHVSLSGVGILVLDEADRMLDMGFAPQLKKILSFVPTERQTMLFSATMPEEIARIAQTYMKKPLHIEVAPPGTTADKIDQEVIIVPREQKLTLLEEILREYSGTVLIFSRTKHGAKKIARKVRDMGHSADELHSNRSQHQRQKALKGFASGQYRILIATDIASRGIDVKNIELVVNYDLPDQIDDYVHRIGRTGRAGRAGKAISFAAPEQKRDIHQIERLINLTLPVSTPTGEPVEIQRQQQRHPQRNQQPRRGNNRGHGRNNSHAGGWNRHRNRNRRRRHQP